MAKTTWRSGKYPHFGKVSPHPPHPLAKSWLRPCCSSNLVIFDSSRIVSECYPIKANAGAHLNFLNLSDQCQGAIRIHVNRRLWRLNKRVQKCVTKHAHQVNTQVGFLVNCNSFLLKFSRVVAVQSPASYIRAFLNQDQWSIDHFGHGASTETPMNPLMVTDSSVPLMNSGCMRS